MKPKKHIAILLTMLVTGGAFVQAQTATRTGPQADKERTVVKSTDRREAPAQRNRTTQVTRSQSQQKNYRSENKQPESQKTVRSSVQRTPQAVNRAGNPRVEPQRSSTPAIRERSNIRQETARTPVAHREKPVSISTPDNPESHYRSPAPRTGTVANKYSEKRYYSGHYYHHVYPASKIKVYHHHDTYLHGYHVLYFPPRVHIYWTRDMYRDYCRWYPNYHWNYRYGYMIQTISVLDAKYNLGEVAMVYGRVCATWYNRDTDDYLLFFGGDYPNQQFTAVLPGRIARKFNWRPERYFLGQHVTVTGLITTFDGIPEIIVKNRQQVALY
jgi:hypothetical protein